MTERKPEEENLIHLSNNEENIGWLVRMSVLDTEVDGSNPSSSMLFP